MSPGGADGIAEPILLAEANHSRSVHGTRQLQARKQPLRVGQEDGPVEGGRTRDGESTIGRRGSGNDARARTE